MLLAGLALAAMADASVLRGFTVRQLQDGADAIVAGKVLRVRSVRAGGGIETVAKVRVERAFRDPGSRVVNVRVPGGERAGRRLVVAGAPEFVPGEDVLLFLYRDGRDWRPVGLFQGVWRLDAASPGSARASSSGGASILRPEVGEAAIESAEHSLQQLVGELGGAR